MAISVFDMFTIGIGPSSSHTVAARVANINETKQLRVLGRHLIRFDPRRDLVFHRRQTLPLHPNGMRFWAHEGPSAGVELRERTYYSVGGGFVVDDQLADEDRIVADETPLPHHPRGPPLLSPLLRLGRSGGRRALLVGRGRHWNYLQDARVDLRSGGWLPGRGLWGYWS